jgi:hypothetical protein
MRRRRRQFGRAARRYDPEPNPDGKPNTDADQLDQHLRGQPLERWIGNARSGGRPLWKLHRDDRLRGRD